MMQLDNHQLDRIFHALSDSTRRSILMQVRGKDESVNTIASQFSISLPAISKHLNVLEKAGLITRRKNGRQRICHAEPNVLENAAEWLDFYQRFWDEKLNILAQYLEQE